MRSLLVTTRCAIRCRRLSTTHSTIHQQDVENILAELKALQTLVREQRSQAYQVESLTRSVRAQSANLETRLQGIEHHVSKISAVEHLLHNAKEALHANPTIHRVVENMELMVQRSAPVVKSYKYYILGFVILLTIVWKFRGTLFYERTSEEVADLARRTLEQDSLRSSIQETLQTVANNPSTLHTLNDLIQTLITDEMTEKELVNLVVYAVNTPEVQKALQDILEMIFEDPVLQRLAGEFLLKGLDIEPVKEMLENQTRDLVCATVTDDAVQQATGEGIQRSLWYTVTPPFLWRFIARKPNENDTANPAADAQDGKEKEASRVENEN